MLPFLSSWNWPGARVRQLARGHADLEEAVALDHQVERIVGLRECALREDDLVGRGARAQAELQPVGTTVCCPGGRARLQQLWYIRS